MWANALDATTAFARKVTPQQFRTRAMSAFRGVRGVLHGGAARLRAFGLGLLLELEPRRRYDLYARADHTRQSWEKVFVGLWEPLLPLFSEGRAFIRVPGPQYGVSGKRGGHHEAFARSFIGASFFLANREDASVTLSKGDKLDLAAIYREGIINGTDPHSGEYWGKRKTIGRLVENCSVAIGLMLTERHIWSKFSMEEKERVLDWFRSEARGYFILNNWQWFKVFHLLLLERLGNEDRRKEIEETLKVIDRMYAGDGWYRDGAGHHAPADYYSAWAMQYYALLFAYLAPDHYGEWKEVCMSRAREFFKTYQHFFAPNSHPPMFGRSQTYRWASISPWGLGFLLGCVDDSVDVERIKSALISTINSFLENGALRKDGILTCGFYREFLPMLEGYSSTGSPYWAFKGFSLLLLPEGHPFWNIPETRKEDTEGIYTVKPVNIILSHSRESHVILFPNTAAPEYPLKYEKFAYSNIFLMNYDRSFPVDNSLLVKKRGGKWLRKGEVLKAFCRDGISFSLWRPQGTGDVLIASVLIAFPNAYVIVHQDQSQGRLEYAIGGFPLSTTSRRVRTEITGRALVLKDGEREVGMSLLHGKGTPGIHRSHKKNPAGPHCYVSFYRGLFSGSEDVVAAAIWGCQYPDSFDIPTMKREGDRIIIGMGDRAREITCLPHPSWPAE